MKLWHLIVGLLCAYALGFGIYRWLIIEYEPASKVVSTGGDGVLVQQMHGLPLRLEVSRPALYFWYPLFWLDNRLLGSDFVVYTR